MQVDEPIPVSLHLPVPEKEEEPAVAPLQSAEPSDHELWPKMKSRTHLGQVGEMGVVRLGSKIQADHRRLQTGQSSTLVVLYEPSALQTKVGASAFFDDYIYAGGMGPPSR